VLVSSQTKPWMSMNCAMMMGKVVGATTGVVGVAIVGSSVGGDDVGTVVGFA